MDMSGYMEKETVKKMYGQSGWNIDSKLRKVFIMDWIISNNPQTI